MSSKITKFPQFDVVSDPSDHHYVTNTPIGPGSAHKRITYEWKLLGKELPNSIYVRVYETRVDLLRAAIVGARGTPYHDGLFFFDIAFPCDYPARPPSVYYRSFGYRINPNLYANGKVCLSLLHTWSGKRCEKWDSEKSNILQVLLSIQALVLNERPYFNEPGYEAFKGIKLWEKKSLTYTQDIYILHCKTMLHLLSTPPNNFKPLVTEHFRERAEFILNAFDMYRKGLVQVGLFDGVLKQGKGNFPKNFKKSTDRWFKDLVRAFVRNGAPVEWFLDRVGNNENDAKEKVCVKKENFVQKLLNFIFGVKKSKTSPVSAGAQAQVVSN